MPSSWLRWRARRGLKLPSAPMLEVPGAEVQVVAHILVLGPDAELGQYFPETTTTQVGFDLPQAVVPNNVEALIFIRSEIGGQQFQEERVSLALG